MVEIDTAEEEIYVARRLGNFKKDQKKPRMMLIRCKPGLRERIMANASNLKEKENSAGDAFYINKQLPEKLAEERKRNCDTVRDIKQKEQSLLVRDKSKSTRTGKFT